MNILHQEPFNIKTSDQDNKNVIDHKKNEDEDGISYNQKKQTSPKNNINGLDYNDEEIKKDPKIISKNAQNNQKDNDRNIKESLQLKNTEQHNPSTTNDHNIDDDNHSNPSKSKVTKEKLADQLFYFCVKSFKDGNIDAIKTLFQPLLHKMYDILSFKDFQIFRTLIAKGYLEFLLLLDDKIYLTSDPHFQKSLKLFIREDLDIDHISKFIQINSTKETHHLFVTLKNAYLDPSQ